MAALLKIERVLPLVGAIALAALLTFVPESSNDFWLQVAIGGLIWNDGEIPRTALFPFTEAQDYPFFAHEWLSSVLFYLLHQALGYESLLLVKGAAGLALLALCARLAYRLTGDQVLALALSLAALTVANFRHFLRPELLALLYLMVLLNLLAEYQLTRRRRYLLWTLPLCALWANSHGSFLVAPVIAAIFAAGAAIERRSLTAGLPYAIAAAGMTLASLLNPYGYRLLLFAWNVSHWKLLGEFITEWRPTFAAPFHGTHAFWAYVLYLALCLAVVIACRRRLPPTALLLLLAFAYLSAQAQRHVALFAYVALYCIASIIGPVSPGPRARRALAAAAVAGIALGITATLRFGNMYGAWPHYVASENFTPPLTEYVRSRGLQGNVFNSYALGAQLIHHFYPQLRPLIDSRIDVYGERYFLHTVHLGTNEQALLDFIERHDVRYFLLTWGHFNEGIATMPRLRERGWQILFADHKAVLLGRAR